MGFIDERYLLDTETAVDLYETIAALPIVDPHNHIDLGTVVENEPWNDIWEVEGATDHYVWQLMRKRGVAEAKITGDATNREKWNALASVFPDFAGNPTYEWVHLDLKRRFGIETPLSSETADEIWAETKAQLAKPDMRPQAVLREMNVEVLCSSDDPTARLEHHKRIQQEVNGVDVRPTWRPDRALKIENGSWSTFVSELDAVTENSVERFEGFLDALAETHSYFEEQGCVACDIALGTDPVSKPVSSERASDVYTKARCGESLEKEAIRDYKAFLLERIGALNDEAGWVTQLHIGAVRDYRDALSEAIGPNAGGDVSTQDIDLVDGLDHFLDRFDEEMEIVLYTLDPSHYPSATVLARAYPNVSIGPAWWFNDSPLGIANQLQRVAAVDLLANYAGMVSDSRKLVSYGSRFELFRRTLASVVGEMVERGRIPYDNAERLLKHVAYDRPKQLYGL